MKLFLKCDADGCDHKETIDKMDEADIGRACPQCGAPLLTREDFIAFGPHFALVKTLEALGLAGGEPSEKPSVLVTVGVHGDETTVKFSKVDA